MCWAESFCELDPKGDPMFERFLTLTECCRTGDATKRESLSFRLKLWRPGSKSVLRKDISESVRNPRRFGHWNESCCQ
jgi:hypothetical protein